MSKKIYVQCNPLLDISAHVNEEFLKKYKLTAGSSILMGDDQKSIYSEIQSIGEAANKQNPAQARRIFIPGGSGLNTARVAQWLLPNEKSAVAFVGAIGKDEYGETLQKEVQKDALCALLEQIPDQPTGSCAVCICGKERTLVARLGAAEKLSPNFLQSAAVQEAKKEAFIVYLTGFNLTVSVDYVLAAANAAHAKPNGIFALNVSAPFIVEFFGDAFLRVFPHVDILFANEVEAQALAKLLKLEVGGSMEQLASAVAAKDYSGNRPEGRLVIFTQGKLPTVFATAKGKKGTVQPNLLDEKEIVDLNGAGDAFVGGFLAALAHGKSVEECIDAAHYAASVIIRHDGCTFPSQPSYNVAKK